MEIVFVGTSIVMDIDDAVEPLVDDIIDHLMHALHPLGIHLAVFIHVIIPGDGHADSSESAIFHHLQQFRLGGFLAPAALGLQSLTAPEVVASEIGDEYIIQILFISLKGVTQIPTKAHVLDGILCRFEICSICAHADEQTTYKK